MDDTDKKYKLNQYQSQFYYEIQTGCLIDSIQILKTTIGTLGNDNDADQNTI